MFSSIKNKVIEYPSKRVFRISELIVADTARNFGSAITRIGHPLIFELSLFF